MLNIKEIADYLKSITQVDENVEAYLRDETPENVAPIPNKNVVVVKPSSVDEVSEVVKYANKNKIPVVVRGGGTGLSGGAIPVKPCIIISMEKLNKILEVDTKNLTITCEAGVTLKELIEAVEKVGLSFPPHPGDESATIGGMVSTNAGGVRAVKYGVMRNYVLGLEVVLPNGEVLKLGGKVIKNVTGYNLMHLIIGSEGTLCIVTKAIIRILPKPKKNYTLVIPFESVDDAIKSVSRILNVITPLAVEYIEVEVIKYGEKVVGKRWVSKDGKAHLMLVVEAKEEERIEIERLASEILELGKITLQIVEKAMLDNLDTVVDNAYKLETNYMGTVDKKKRVNYYDGIQAIIDVDGKEIGKFKGKDYLNHVSEKVVQWSYSKIPYLKAIGWKGISDGKDTSLYMVGPIARLNVAKKVNGPLAQEAFERMVEVIGEKPIHYILTSHWARAIEMLNAAERLVELSQDEEITSPDVRSEVKDVRGEGVGIVEAPRGTLIHHYITDTRGIVREANLVVATTQNMGPINLAVKKVAKRFIKNGNVNDRILNHVEKAFRAFDPCLACATHAVNGKIPIEVSVYRNGELVKTLQNFS